MKKHKLKINVSAKPNDDAIVNCGVFENDKVNSQISTNKMTIIIPGDSVKSIEVEEIKQED